MLQLTTIFLVIASSILATLHFLGLEFFLYWRFWWFDIVMHAFGGAVIALAILSLYDFRVPIPKRWSQLLPVVLIVMVVALGWELYEILIGIPIEVGHEIDTAVDLLMGAAGAALGWLVGSRLQNLR